MFDNIVKFFKNLGKKEKVKESSDTAKERLHLVLMQDRANVSADFLELMKQEIIEVIKKYIDVDEKAIDVRLTNKTNEDGTVGAPALYANIPITTIKDEARKANVPQNKANISKLEESKEEASKKGKTNKDEKVEIEEEKEKQAEDNQENKEDASEKNKEKQAEKEEEPNKTEKKETSNKKEKGDKTKEKEGEEKVEKIIENAQEVQNEVESQKEKKVCKKD